MSYLIFRIEPRRLNYRTDVWAVQSDSHLGWVRWHSPWRRYCFFPTQEVIFDGKCLLEIVQFLDKENLAHKEGRRL